MARTGVPFYLSHTIVKAEGSDHVTGVTIAEGDNHFQFIPGTEKQFDVDTICLAVGLSPMSQLLKMAGCEMEDNPKRVGQKTGRCILHRGRSGGIKEDQRKDSPGCDCKTCI